MNSIQLAYQAVGANSSGLTTRSRIPSCPTSSRLELDHDADAHLGFTSAKVGVPDTAEVAAGCLRRCQIVCPRRCAGHARVVLRKTVISAGRRDSSATGEIR